MRSEELALLVNGEPRSVPSGCTVGGLLETLRNRLGFRYIRSMERGVLWTAFFDGPAGEDSVGIAKDMAEKLLVNKHYQECKIIGSV